MRAALCAEGAFGAKPLPRNGLALANGGGYQCHFHENLVAWQRADDLFIAVHRLTHQRFPASERYELGSQLRRAAWSIPANLVEGIARGHGRESIRFFKISRASLSELGYGMHACTRLGYLKQEELEAYQQKLGEVAAPLQGLIKKRRLESTTKTVCMVLLVIIALGALAA